MRTGFQNKTRILTITYLKNKILNYEKWYEPAIITKSQKLTDIEYKKHEKVLGLWHSGYKSSLYMC